MPKIEVTYFNSPGRAEPVRVALRLANVPFVDTRIDFPQFGAMRAEGRFPLGSVPVLAVDDVVIPQTAAMLRYAARLGDGSLYPSDPYQAFLVDSVVDSFNDTLSAALVPSFFEQDPEKKVAMRRAFVEGPMARVFAFVEGLITRSGGPFLIGAQMTIADLIVGNQVAQLQSGRLDGITAGDLAPWPRILALAAAYENEPRIVASRAQ